MFERFTHEVRDVVEKSVAEAGRRGDRKVTTEHLVIGVLHDPAIAHEVGVTPDRARQVADRLDRDALAAIGLDVDAYGPLDSAVGGRLPFAPGAKAALRGALTHCSAERGRRIEARHLLAALRDGAPPDPGAVLLAELRAEPSA